MKLILREKVTTPAESCILAQKIWNEILFPEKNFSVFLEGGLGTGKTFLVREILRTAGISEPVPSPTYTLVNDYKNNERQFAHFDFYRLDDPHDFFKRGLSELAEDPAFSTFIEWADKIPESAHKGFSGRRFVIQLKHGPSVGQRVIDVYDAGAQ